jgi:hypothetical protein
MFLAEEDFINPCSLNLIMLAPEDNEALRKMVDEVVPPQDLPNLTEQLKLIKTFITDYLKCFGLRPSEAEKLLPMVEKPLSPDVDVCLNELAQRNLQYFLNAEMYLFAYLINKTRKQKTLYMSYLQLYESLSDLATLLENAAAATDDKIKQVYYEAFHGGFVRLLFWMLNLVSNLADHNLLDPRLVERLYNDVSALVKEYLPSK